MNGINFKPDMIQAIIEGRKTQTRRVIKPQPFLVGNNRWHWLPHKNAEIHWTEIYDMGAITKFARYQVGETVYVKEAGVWDKQTGYRAYKSNIPDVQAKWQSPLFMPEWAARYFITITDVRAERLQEITIEDAIAEGCRVESQSLNQLHPHFPIWKYKVVWNSINAKWKRVYNTELKIYEFWQFPWCEEDAKPIPKTTQHPERYHCVPNPWVFVYAFKQDKEKIG